MLRLAAIFSISSNLGYLLPAVIGLESMGVPSPGETALVLAAVLASQGKLNIWLVILIGVTSAIIGDNIGYFLGRKVGREVLEAPGPLQHRRKSAIAAGDKFFERHGPKAVFIGRWIALIRVATAWLAGINHMPFRQFFVWNALGGITWGVAFGLAGYFGGQAAANVITRFGAYGAVALAVLFVAAWVVVKIRERRAVEPDDESDAADEPAPTSASPDPDPASTN
ncbi:MAG TPA: DedA family protein [Solirubrobacteraceae bacterium]|nr:DedA family protein [Solirubrobacteraceae bacterium]